MAKIDSIMQKMNQYGSAQAPEVLAEEVVAKPLATNEQQPIQRGEAVAEAATKAASVKESPLEAIVFNDISGETKGKIAERLDQSSPQQPAQGAVNDNNSSKIVFRDIQSQTHEGAIKPGAEKVELSEKADQQINSLLTVLTNTFKDEIPALGLKTAFNAEVDIDSKHPLANAINNLDNQKPVSISDLREMLKEHGATVPSFDTGTVSNAPSTSETKSTVTNENIKTSGNDVISSNSPEVGSARPEQSHVDASKPNEQAATQTSSTTQKQVTPDPANESQQIHNIKQASSTSFNDVLGIGAIVTAITSKIKTSGVEASADNAVPEQSQDIFKNTRTEFDNSVKYSDISQPIMKSLVSDTLDSMYQNRKEIIASSNFVQDSTPQTSSHATAISHLSQALDDYSARTDTIGKLLPGLDMESRTRAFHELKDGMELLNEIKIHDDIPGTDKLKEQSEKLAEQIQDILKSLNKIFSRDAEANSPSP